MRSDMTIEIGPRSYHIERMSPRAQFEAECILLAVLGPAASVGIGAVIEPFIELLAERLRGLLGIGTDSFDLARIAGLLDVLDTADPELEAMVSGVLDGLGLLTSRTLDTVGPVLAELLTWPRLARLLELAVIGPVFVLRDGKPARIANLDALDAAVGRHPAHKWALLLASLRFTYLDTGEETEGEG